MIRTAAFIVALIALSACRPDILDASSKSTAMPGVLGTLLSAGEGQGDAAGRDFTVPDRCDRQELRYRLDGGKIEISIIDRGRNETTTIGPLTEDGAQFLALRSGEQYAVAVGANSSEWGYTLICR